MLSSSFAINNVVASVPNVFDHQSAPTTGLGRSTVSQNASSRLQTGWFEVVVGPDEGELDITQALGDTIAHRQSPIDASTTARHYLDTTQDEELDVIELTREEVDIVQPRPSTPSASPEVPHPPTPSPLAALDKLDKEVTSWETCLAMAEAMGDDLSLPPSPASILPTSSDSLTAQDPESYDESFLFPDECTTTVAISYDDLFREEVDPEEEYQEDPAAIAAQGEDPNAPTSNWFRPASSPQEAISFTKVHVSILQDRREERGIVSIRIMNYQAAKALDLPATAFDLPADVVMRRERAPISKMGRGSPLRESVTAASYFESQDSDEELEEGEIREEISRSSSASSLSAYSTGSDLQGQGEPWSSPDSSPSSSPELECATLPPRPSTPLPFVRSTSSPYHTPAPTPQPSPALSEWALDDDEDELPSLDCWAPTPSRHDYNENKDLDLSLGLSFNSVASVPSTSGIF